MLSPRCMCAACARKNPFGSLAFAVPLIGRVMTGGHKRVLTRVCVFTLACSLGFTQLLGGEVAIAQDPREQGLWEGPYAMPVVPIHAALLPTGDVLVYSSGSSARLLNWVDWTFRPVPTGENIFCSGHTFLADGTLLVTGGALANNRGLPVAHLFDPFTETWTRLDDMARGRWYPTNTTLLDGRILVVSGRDEEGLINDIPEVYTPGAGWTPLTEAQLTLPLYPYLFVLPDSRIFYAGPGNPTRTFEVEAQTWATVGNSQIGGGSAVMYAPGKVLKRGGGDPAIPRMVVIDMTQASPTWQEVAPMAFPRRRHNLTVLPDGKVLVTGGTRVGNDEGQAVYAAELWDPSTRTWTSMANMQVARMYHSTALPLADGRVLSAGGSGKFSAEIYSPPYLFAGPRPEIASAPSSVSYGNAFDVSTPQAPDIASVALIRLSAVTRITRSSGMCRCALRSLERECWRCERLRAPPWPRRATTCSFWSTRVECHPWRGSSV
jgi:galactose oxidase